MTELRSTPRQLVAIGATAAVIGAVLAVTSVLKTLSLLIWPMFPGRSFPGCSVLETVVLLIRPAFGFAFGFLGFLAGVHLVRGRSWARLLLEVLGWVGGVSFVAFAVAAFRIAFTDKWLARGVSVSLATSYLVYAVVLGIMIYHLHKPSVRAALREEDEEAGEPNPTNRASSDA